MERIIRLYDDYTTLLVRTNAPSQIIDDAIEYRDDMLTNDDPAFRSDFEEMHDFINNKGYSFEEIGYIEDIEGYYW